MRSGQPTSAPLLALLMLAACERKAHERAEPAPVPTHETARLAAPAQGSAKKTPASDYQVPLRSDDQLREEVKSACQASQISGRPLLLEAGADWCGDCRLVHRMKKLPPLATELEHWQTFDVNLGEDRHEWLRAAFQIKAIARWLVFRPDDCDAPLESWSLITGRVVEPTSGGKSANSAFLADWLAQARQSGAP